MLWRACVWVCGQLAELQQMNSISATHISVLLLSLCFSANTPEPALPLLSSGGTNQLLLLFLFQEGNFHYVVVKKKIKKITSLSCSFLLHSFVHVSMY